MSPLKFNLWVNCSFKDPQWLVDINESVSEEVCVGPEAVWVRLQWDWCGPGFYQDAERRGLNFPVFSLVRLFDSVRLFFFVSCLRVSVVSVLSDPPAGLCHTQLHEQSRCSPAEGGQGGPSSGPCRTDRPLMQRRVDSFKFSHVRKMKSCWGQVEPQVLSSAPTSWNQSSQWTHHQSELSVNTSLLNISSPRAEYCILIILHWLDCIDYTAFWINNKHHIHISTSRDMNLTGVWTRLSRWH